MTTFLISLKITPLPPSKEGVVNNKNRFHNNLTAIANSLTPLPPSKEGVESIVLCVTAFEMTFGQEICQRTG